MDYSFLDFLTLVGAIGMFLYGMKIMSEGLQKIAGDKLRNFLSAMTSNRVKGVFTGFLITAIIQSSTATTVMVVSFVNAKLLTLAQAIGVIMGANIGTTLTAWIISFFGFQVDMGVLAIPFIGLCIPLIFSKNNSRRYIGEFIMGFALLFLAIAYLKNSVPDLQGHPEILSFIQDYTSMGFGSIILFLMVGTILTIVLQSSTATIAITIIMCTKGWIPLEIAMAMVLGENIGTTITANIAAIGANVQAKRAAFAHFIFNVFGVCWMLAVFYHFTDIVTWLVSKYGPGNPTELQSYLGTLSPDIIELVTSNQKLTDPNLIAIQQKILSLQVSVSYSLSLFHTLYNIVNVLVMIWFVKIYVKVCTFVIKPKKENEEEEFQLKYISSRMFSTSELSLVQANQEIALYGKRVQRMFGIVKELYKEEDSEKFREQFNRIEKYEEISDRMELEIANYLTRVLEGRLSSFGKENVRLMLRSISEIESVADACNNIAKAIKRRNDGKSKFTDEQNNSINMMFSICDKAINRMVELLDKPEKEISKDDINLSINIEHEINNYRDKLKNDNLENIDAKKYEYQDAIYYMDIVSECERLGDYVINVAQAIVKIKN